MSRFSARSVRERYAGPSVLVIKCGLVILNPLGGCSQGAFALHLDV